MSDEQSKIASAFSFFIIGVQLIMNKNILTHFQFCGAWFWQLDNEILGSMDGSGGQINDVQYDDNVNDGHDYMKQLYAPYIWG